MSEPFLEIRNLRLSLEDRVLLSGVSLGVQQGELCCLIGPNGAGKSTLLKCIDMLYAGWSGRISVEGAEIRSLSRRGLSRLIGYVPQCREFLPDFQVGEFLLMSRYACVRGSMSGKAVAEAALRRVGLAGFEERRLGTLSGGECQKVFIAAGLVQETPLLLLDEPTAFLDPRFQGEVNRLLYELCHRDGVTVLCVSHDLNSSLLYGDRLIGLKEGRVVWETTDKTPEDVVLLESLFDTRFAYGTHPGRSSMTMIMPWEPDL